MRTPGVRLTLGTLLAGIAWSCASQPPPPPQPPAPPLVTPPLAAVAPPVAASASPPPPRDPCPPLARGEVSEDDTPSIAGAPGKAKAGDWLEARGVTKAAFRSWLRAHDPKNLEDFDADSLFDNDDSCQKLVVGDKNEEALVCSVAVRTSIMRFSAYVFVVRNKRIAPVLEVGYALPAMDWPDSRWLDLQLVFAPGGLEADLHDRAPPGAVLAPAPSWCHEHFARYLACEKAHREGTPLDDVCPRVMDQSQQMSFGHMTPLPSVSPVDSDRVPLLGCDAALPKLNELIKNTNARDTYAVEFRGDRAFAVTSCKARGRYVWKGDRFVRAAP